MNTTGKWIQGWLEISRETLDSIQRMNERGIRSQLNLEFSAGKEEVEVFWLNQLHDHLKDVPVEAEVWKNLIYRLLTPIPLYIVRNLSKYPCCVSALGHTQKEETTLRYLASYSGEALLTLAGELYRNPERSVKEFQDVLDQYPQHPWVLGNIAHMSPSSSEKENAFMTHIENLPEREIAVKMKAFRSEQEQKERMQKEQIERASHSNSAEELQDLFSAGCFEVLYCLAQNPHISDELLALLSQVREFSGASVIRQVARNAQKIRKIQNV